MLYPTTCLNPFSEVDDGEVSRACMRVRNVGQDFPEKVEWVERESVKGRRGCGAHLHKASLKRRHKDGEGRKEMPIDLLQRRYFHGASWIFIKRWFVLYCRSPCSDFFVSSDSFSRFSIGFFLSFPSFFLSLAIFSSYNHSINLYYSKSRCCVSRSSITALSLDIFHPTSHVA